MSVYAIADLHGRYDLWSKARDYLYDEDSLLICLGDCIDRGPDGIKIVNEMRERPNTIYLKGNHEDMAAAALYDLNGISIPRGRSDIWFYNGGHETYKSLSGLTQLEQVEYGYFFNNLPLEYVYHNVLDEKVILTHAGFTPGEERDLLWDRSSFNHLWPLDERNTKIIHGHTPVQYLEFSYGHGDKNPYHQMDVDEAFDKWDPHAIWYCGGHKCDIDLGTAASNKTMLLNLDTWEEVYFE